MFPKHSALTLLEKKAKYLEVKKISKDKIEVYIKINYAAEQLNDLIESYFNPFTRKCSNINILIQQLCESYNIIAGTEESKNLDSTELLRESNNLCASLKRLGEIGKGDIEVTAELIHLLINDNNYESNSAFAIYDIVVDSLKKIISNNLFIPVVTVLKESLNKLMGKESLIYKRYSEIIWHCAHNMSYPDFYRAWHGKSSTVKTLEN
jgi:hypothetical protein